jgi:hypothetical protein
LEWRERGKNAICTKKLSAPIEDQTLAVLSVRVSRRTVSDLIAGADLFCVTPDDPHTRLGWSTMT